MCGTVVRRCSSVAIPARRSSCTPISSSPSPSTSGPRPIETSIRSASTLSPSPKCTRSPFPSSSTRLHCFASWSAIPRLPNAFASSFAASASSCGISVSSISTMVTSEPKRWKMDANSHPMMPPPSTTSRRGTCVCASSPVESTQRGESSPSIGGRSGNEPVATIALLNWTSSPPSTASVFGPLKPPRPLTHSTPFALKRPATPPVICLTTPFFHSTAWPKFSCGRLTSTPNLAKVSPAWCIACAVWTHAFVGMQPTRRQVPPSSGSCSMQTVFAPSWAARIDAVYPPGPPPRTATSHSIAQPFRRKSALDANDEFGTPAPSYGHTTTEERTMRKLVESTFMSLDGVIDSPQNWSAPYWDDEHSAYAQKLMARADELLLGRKTYEGFAEAWPQRSGDPYTDKINAMPKHVASRRLTDLTWNAQPLQGEAVEAVGELKQRDGEDLLKFGTGEFSRTLIENELLDELHVWIFPVLVGGGQRLIDGIDVTHLELFETTRFRSGIVVNAYA